MFSDKKIYPIILAIIFFPTFIASCAIQQTDDATSPPTPKTSHLQMTITTTPQGLEMINFPAPKLQGSMSLEETLSKRRSVREFQNTPLTEIEMGQLLWSAQGITHPSGYRTSPSAGALYPLEIYVAISTGLYHYDPDEHQMVQILEHDVRPDLHRAALQQDSVIEAPMVIAIAAVFSRTAQRYGETRTPLYVHLEAGHAAQNILLQAVALDLGSVPIGAFIDEDVKVALSLPDDQQPLYLIPVGHPK